MATYEEIPVDPTANAYRAAIGEDLLVEVKRLTPRLAAMEDSYRELHLDLRFQEGTERNARLLGAAAYQVLRSLFHSDAVRPTSLPGLIVRMPLWMAAVAVGVFSGVGFLYFMGIGPERVVLRPRMFNCTAVSVNGDTVAWISHLNFCGAKAITVSFDNTPVGAAMQDLWTAEAPTMWQGIPLWSGTMATYETALLPASA